MLSTVFFLFTALEARVKNQAIAQVENQGLQVVQEITQIVRNATDINNPSAGNSSAQLSVDVISGSLSPAVFDLSSDSIRTKEGASSAIELIHSPVITSGLNFKNLTATDSPGTVRFEFTLTHNNPSGRHEYTYSKDFAGSASLRLDPT